MVGKKTFQILKMLIGKKNLNENQHHQKPIYYNNNNDNNL